MEFLRQKWSYWFSSLDVHHDGMITRADVKKTMRDFLENEQLNKDDRKIADHILKHWWNTYILKGRDTVTKEDFLNDLEKQYRKDKDEFINMIQDMGEELIGVIDIDHTNEITLDGYVKAFRIWGYENEALLKKAFELFKPDHGIVSVEDYCYGWLIFLTNEDPSVKDVVLQAYKEGL